MGQSAAGEKTNNFLEAQIKILPANFFQKTEYFTRPCFVFETLDITLRRQICLTQGVILSHNSNFFATIAALVITSRPQVKNLRKRYVFCLRHSL